MNSLKLMLCALTVVGFVAGTSFANEEAKTTTKEAHKTEKKSKKGKHEKTEKHETKTEKTEKKEEAPAAPAPEAN